MEINNTYISTEAIQNLLSVYLQWSIYILDVYRSSDIEAHKLVPDFSQTGKCVRPIWGNFTSTLAQCYIDFGIWPSLVASLIFFPFFFEVS